MKKRNGFPHLVIRASAGTGKTHQLAMRFIGLIAAGAQPDEILATTFTRKAAGEILDRVLFRLAQAAGEERACKVLAKEIGDSSLTRAKVQELLVGTIRRLHRLQIGTLDSFFIQVATSFGQELGLPPGWSICDELIDATIRDEAIELVLSRGRMGDLLTLVHSLTKGNAARSVNRLVQDVVSGMLELHRETKPEVWEQVAHSQGLPAEELERTLDTLAALEVADKRMREARDSDLLLARSGLWDQFIMKGLAAKMLSGECAFYKKPLPEELMGLYRELLKQAESVLIGQIARQTAATQYLLLRFAEAYEALQLEERLLRFGDVTARLAQSASMISPEQHAFRMDGGIRHVLLDEFQDTAPAQWRVVRTLAQRVTTLSGGSFFCVGDVKQAIYGWRGGVAEIFDALGEELTGLTQADLAESYRSSQAVIDAVNEVFGNLTKHPNLDKLAEPVAQWQKRFPIHTTARKELAGYVTMATGPIVDEEQDQTDATFQYAAERVAEVLKDAPRASVGILVRTNAAVARLIYLLREKGIPASEEGGNPLIDSPAVELILSLLTLGDHPGDRVARFHLATSPLAEALALAGANDNAGAARVSREVRRQLQEDGYGATVFAWATKLGASCDQRELSRLQQLVEMAYDYQPTSTLRADDFIRLVQKKRIADPTSSEVRVMTIHQAKGLQFDVVFLPELGARLTGQPSLVVSGREGPTQPINAVCRYANESVRQFLPPRLQQLFVEDLRRDVSEALCVLYVAMTRAVHGLYMIIPPAKANEKSLPKTFAGLLRATLANEKPASGGQVLYERGEARWFEGEGCRGLREASSLTPTDGTRSVPTTIVLAAAAKREKGLERTSPSALEGGRRLAAGQVLAPRADSAFKLGTLWHAWLEQIEWLDAGVPDDEALRTIAMGLRSKIGDVVEQLDSWMAKFRAQVADPAAAAVLGRQRYSHAEVEVFRERRFAIRDGESMLVGSIDRLVVAREAGRAVMAEIVDFKTDEFATNDAAALSARVMFYKPQMDAYRRAAAKLQSLDPTHVAVQLVFLQAGVVQSIPV